MDIMRGGGGLGSGIGLGGLGIMGLGIGAAGMGLVYTVVTGVEGIGPLGRGHVGRGVEGIGLETVTGLLGVSGSKGSRGFMFNGLRIGLMLSKNPEKSGILILNYNNSNKKENSNSEVSFYN